jgi:hypothetical protein
MSQRPASLDEAHGRALLTCQRDDNQHPERAGTQPATTQATHRRCRFKGKTVVLKWTNHECPYVGKHYRGNNMQALPKKWTGQGVVWLSVLSSALGQPGYVSPQQANELTADRGAAPTAVLLDPTGKVGHGTAPAPPPP